ncbi:MAG: TIGR02147 family protein [Chitinivibrionales bacterium]|nr:TIGR02147 family protein [Chitinivibrionales bacterium]
MPKIYNYLDYRHYLADLHREIKAKKSIFSHRYISAKVGVSSPAWFLHITKGRINLSPGKIQPLSRVFHLNPHESDYLTLLVHYQHAGTMHQKSIIKAKMRTFRRMHDPSANHASHFAEPELHTALG